MTTPAQIREASDKLHTEYRRNFGGLPRITRDADLLRQIRAETVRLREQSPKKATQLREALRARIALYTKELRAIEQEQSQGPFAMAAARVANDANAAFDRYRRNFGGKSRWSRDTDLLEELIEELILAESNFKLVLENWDHASVRRDLEVVQKNIELYTNELRAIHASRENLDDEQRVSETAGSANTLFDTYRTLFAGLPRQSRRPELLERLLNSLREIEKRMVKAAAEGNTSPHLRDNMKLVRRQVELWEVELPQLQQARAAATLNDLVMALGAEIDALWTIWREDYAGQPRETRDLERLSGVLDRSDELTRQARELHRDNELQATDRLLRVARDQRTIFVREYAAIQEAIEKRTVH